VFSIDLKVCRRCQKGELRIIDAVQSPDVIEKILKHLGLDSSGSPEPLPRPPPEPELFDWNQDQKWPKSEPSREPEDDESLAGSSEMEIQWDQRPWASHEDWDFGQEPGRDFDLMLEVQ
jgi:hypothetical protein